MTAVERIAGATGWTAGQVWTVALGVAVAVPASIFGLGPALDDAVGDAQPLAAPPAAAHVATGAPSPAPVAAAAPAILPAGGATRSPGGGATGTPTGSGPGAAVPPASPVGPLATIDGPGSVRALAVAADAVVVAVDAGPGASGRAVVVDLGGDVVADVALEADGVRFASPGGVAVSEHGTFVTTSSPPALLRVDVGGSSVTKVADLTDEPICLPLPAAPCPRPAHLAVADDGVVYVADRGQGCILRIGPGEDVATAWLCELSFVASPAAAAADAAGLTGLAVAGDRVVVSVAAAVDGTDRVSEVPIVEGAPGDVHQLATPATGSGTSGVAVLADGRIVATLTGRDALLVVAADGTSSEEVPLAPLAAPFDVDVIDGDLLVAHAADGAAGAVTRRPL